MKKKIILGLAFISLLVSFCFVGESYAKYVTNVNNVASMSVARWKILINNKDILNKNEASQIITPVFLENEHINSNVIAPTSKGYFELVLDATGADVSFSYEISTSINADSAVRDLKITGYSIDDGEIIDVSSSSLISGNILYTDTKVKNIKVYIEWSDTENDTMDNKADTEARNKQAKLDVKLNFKQIAN